MENNEDKITQRDIVKWYRPITVVQRYNEGNLRGNYTTIYVFGLCVYERLNALTIDNLNFWNYIYGKKLKEPLPKGNGSDTEGQLNKSK